MSIRNLGDWSPLDRHSDPIHTDPDKIRSAQERYQHISTTIDDAVTRLQKIVDANSDSLVGQYVEGLKKDAGSVKDKLSKAAVRYRDVAGEIAKYEPELDQGLRESAAALDDARAAKTAQAKADSMPDPQQADDGTISAEEQQKGTDKNKATAQADADLSNARKRLSTALDALNVAGKRLGDAVNCKRYHDGLTDTFKDKLNAFFAKISKIFAIIGMVLAVLAIIIPGVNLLVLGSVVAGAVALVADSVLYANGEGSLLDVVLGAVGLGLAGLGAIASVAAKSMSASAKTAAGTVGKMRPVTRNPPRLEFSPGALGENIELGAMGGGRGAAGAGAGGRSVFTEFTSVPKDFVVPKNPATQWTNTADWFNNPGVDWLLGKGGFAKPDIGFWQSFGIQSRAAWNTLWKPLLRGESWKAFFSGDLSGLQHGFQEWAAVIGGFSGFRDLSAIMAAVGGKISPAWFAWGLGNNVAAFGQLVYSGGRLSEWIPDVNPPEAGAE